MMRAAALRRIRAALAQLDAAATTPAAVAALAGATATVAALTGPIATGAAPAGPTATGALPARDEPATPAQDSAAQSGHQSGPAGSATDPMSGTAPGTYPNGATVPPGPHPDREAPRRNWPPGSAGRPANGSTAALLAAPAVRPAADAAPPSGAPTSPASAAGIAPRSTNVRSASTGPAGRQTITIEGMLSQLEDTVDRATAKLLEAESTTSRLLAALAQVPEGVVIADHTGTIVYRNPQAAAYVGSRHGEALAERALSELLIAALAGRRSEECLELFSPVRRTLAIRANPLDPAADPRSGPVQGPRPPGPVQGPRPPGPAQGQRPPGPAQGPRPSPPSPGPATGTNTLAGVAGLAAAARWPGGAVAIIEDITEKRRLEAVRRDFVANISHELKTPVGALTLVAETLEGEDDPAVVARLSRRMRAEAERLGRIIEDLLDLSRIEAEESPSREPVLVHLVVSLAVDRLRPTADHRHIRLELDPISRNLVVRGDRRQLVSAAHNLVDNAIKYSEEGSSVQIGVTANEEWIELSVADHGIGIPSRDLERVFERFYRVDRARSRDTGGTGLGLSIVRHVAGNHGGVVSVESREGEGSTFHLRLPNGTPTSTGGGDPGERRDD